MEESSITNPSSIHDQKESEPPTTAPEMIEQEVTTLVCPSPLPLTAAPEEEWGPIPNDIFLKDTTTTTFAPWGFVTVILGILGLLLMLTSIFFGYQYMQHVKQSASQVDGFTKELESFHNKENFTGKLKKMQEDILWNIKIGIDGLFDILTTRKINQEPFLKHWKQYKDNCYQQTLQVVSWFNCPALCSSMNSTFLQSGNQMLMDFLMTFTLNDTWIGISYDQNSKMWKWRNGSSYPFPKPPKPEQNLKELCLYIKLNTMDSYHCNKTLPCMCEKKGFQC